MRLYDFCCDHCGLEFERLVERDELVSCCGLPARRLISAVSYIWNCSAGGSTQPRGRANQEPRRQEAKRGRVMTQLDKHGLNEKNKVDFVDPKKARRK